MVFDFPRLEFPCFVAPKRLFQGTQPRCGLAAILLNHDYGRSQAVLAPVGELDADDEHELRRLLIELLSTDEGVLVDLSDATFLDSRIVSALVDSHVESVRMRIPGIALVMPYDTALGIRRLLLRL